MHPDEPDLDRPPSPADQPHDGAPRPDPELSPPATADALRTTPVPEPDPADESARQTAATLRSVSRLEEAN